MNNKSTTRSAALIAALIAVPLALVAGYGAFMLLRPHTTTSDAGAPTPSAAAPTVPVPMPTRSVTDHQDLVCRGFIAALPQTLHNLPRRTVSDGYEQNAAYGDPALTVACGVPAPTVEPTATVYVLDGVCWMEQPEGDGHRFTTVDRAVPIEVTVPGAYDPPGAWIVPFGDTIISTVRSSGHAPTGCTG